MDDYLTNTVQYPQEAPASGIQGTEVVRFMVTPEGDVSGFSIINSVCPEIDAEVIRALDLFKGMWQPGCFHIFTPPPP